MGHHLFKVGKGSSVCSVLPEFFDERIGAHPHDESVFLQVGTELKPEPHAVKTHPMLGIEGKGMGSDGRVGFAGAWNCKREVEKNILAIALSGEGIVGNRGGHIDRIVAPFFYLRVNDESVGVE